MGTRERPGEDPTEELMRREAAAVARVEAEG